MSDQHWSALVISPDDRLDADLLAAITLAAGVSFEYAADADFGTGVRATTYTAGTEQVIEIDCAHAKALFIRVRSRERAAAIEASISRHTRTWTEQVLRNQLESSLEHDPYALVPLLMACGGGAPEPATADLLHRALEHADEQVREAADYAMRMSKAWTSFCGVS